MPQPLVKPLGLLLAAASVLALGACKHSAAESAPQAAASVPTGTAAAATDWRSVATEQDRARIRDWRKLWLAAISNAKANGSGGAVVAEGVLLDPDAALPNPHMPPGVYRCRVIKVGGQNGTLAFVAYGWFQCRVVAEQDVFSLTKTTGSQRQVGLMFDDGPLRKVFLGTMILGDEQRAFDYGVDAARDVSGVVERIGTRRWRLAMPAPAHESMLDVMEIVPQ